MSKLNHRSIDHVEPKHLIWFVNGAVLDYIDRTGALNRQSPHLTHLIESVMSVVRGYLTGTRFLDGACSDIQCHVAFEAEKLFKPVLDVDQWKVEALVELRKGDGSAKARAIGICRQGTSRSIMEAAHLVERLRDGMNGEVEL